MAFRKTKSYRAKSSSGSSQPVLIGLAILGAVALIALLAYAVWAATQPVPLLGEEIPVVSSDHIPVGQKASNYVSDPPTSGEHYDQPAEAGFYDEAPPDEQLVHNLEHGHIVLYYNCTNLSENECTELKEDIRAAMNSAGLVPATGTPKLVAVPRPSMDNQVTYTSWGRLYRAGVFDPDEFRLFVQQNRNRAPEPQAP